MMEFTFSGYSLHYTDSITESPTNAPVIVFIHGLASSSKVYAAQIKHFRHMYRCIALDLFGHGNSDSPSPISVGSEFYSLSSHAKSIMALLSHLAVETATFIGWSLGSIISLTIALAYPKILDNLILVATTPVFFIPEGDDFPGLGPSEAAMFLDNVENHYEIFYEPFVLGQYPEAKELHPRPDYVEEAISDAASMLPDVIFQNVALSGNTDLRPSLREIKTRTLIINGSDDIYCQLSGAKWMAGVLEDCTFISYVHCGHVPFVGPFSERFSTDVAVFLKNGKLLH